MFCPNCGNNCGDAKFCSACGTQVQQKAEQKKQPAVWTVGMPCPHCGGTKLEGNNCSFCGAQLLADISDESVEELEWEDSYDFPYRGFYQRGTTVTLEYSFLTIEKKRLFSKERTRIPFTKLAEAEFSYYGGETARMLFTTTDGNRISVEIGNENRNCELYFVIFYLIKNLAVPETEFITELPSVDTDSMERLGIRVDLRSYFDRFNPSRERAAAALSRECQILLEEAEPIIDSAFYTYQKELYEGNPIFAVRDYNRVMAERNQRYEVYAREVDSRGLKARR